MAAIRSRGNKSTEIVFLKFLRDHHITGWRRHDKKVEGTPDFVFLKKKIAVFIDGCFWHACKKCSSFPKSNRAFWENKIRTNKIRDKRINSTLRRKGWKVLRIWEHELKDKNKITLTLASEFNSYSVV